MCDNNVAELSVHADGRRTKHANLCHPYRGLLLPQINAGTVLQEKEARWVAFAKCLGVVPYDDVEITFPAHNFVWEVAVLWTEYAIDDYIILCFFYLTTSLRKSRKKSGLVDTRRRFSSAARRVARNLRKKRGRELAMIRWGLAV